MSIRVCSVADFADQSVMITGAASGIGRAITERLAENGARTIVIDLNEAALEEMRAAHGDTMLCFSGDISDPKWVDDTVNRAADETGRIDALVHCAGVGLEADFIDTSIEQWRRVINVDLTGTFVVCQAVAKVMIPNRYGRILTLSSTAGIRGGTGRAAYGASKGGVIALTKVMAVELAAYGITANTLAPGAIETELVKKMHSAETRVVYKRSIPQDRYGTPEEVADAALFLISRSASYVNGATMTVDGGFVAGGVMHRRGVETMSHSHE